MNNYFKFLVLAFLSITFSSCDPDDDGVAPMEPDPQANEFVIGTTNYLMSRGFRSGSSQDNPNLFVTNVALVSDGLTLNSNNELTGNGNLVAFEFYTTANNGLQAGTYNLDNVNDQAQTVYVYTGVGYNAQTGDATDEDDIFQGTITVSIENNGSYTITGQGTADNANATFTVNYTGTLQLVN